ncbi:NADAR family protein [Paenibacillus cellulositrophicus]|uniref:NADAR family protein n=1 Tax=Paenibacillus cellulositrophicus TaxID=562959 RepID=UPI0012675ACA|nr:NADAR family protein [Paenibacillus cellulositrophicus]
MYTLEELRKAFRKGTKLKYVFFWGHQPAADGSITKSCFSQWWEAKFTVDGVEYVSAEHYMMAEKARLFGDEEIREQILAAKHPKQAKDLGRKVRGFDPAVWDREGYSIVVRGNEAKFSQNDDLKQFLLGTGQRVLVEASPVDSIWGVGLAADDEAVLNPLLWKGKNLLGFALMEVRDRLQAEEA